MSTDATRLWEKGAALDAAIHRFTVGDDPYWDRRLVHWDCLGSAAHARTLSRAGLLDASELGSLLTGLATIDARARDGAFAIPAELEDCHTAIEAELIRSCGAAGEKIHAGRSRNDQVATALRLFMRHHALDWAPQVHRFIEALAQRAAVDGNVPMPGYTHLQPAMPSTVGAWLHALAEAALEQYRALLDLLGRLDSCPLGTGAGYGVPLPLDREYTASLLGFTRVQRSAIDVQNSRGRMEKYFVRVAADFATLLEKLSSDLILFATAEFGFIGLPDALTTGSSIMPQKRNPDVLELLRARGARLRTRLSELEAVTAGLTSGYHRDLQLTKEPPIRTAEELPDMLLIATRVIADFTVDRDRLQTAMRPELYATHAALALTTAGVPFREAYRRIADEVRGGRFDANRAREWRDNPTGVANTIWDAIRDECTALRSQCANVAARIASAESALLPASE